jgi:hypothetical protein
MVKVGQKLCREVKKSNSNTAHFPEPVPALPIARAHVPGASPSTADETAKDGPQAEPDRKKPRRGG